MERTRTTSSAWCVVVILAAVAFTGAVVSTRHGAEVGPDSVTYVSTARNLAHGAGFVDFTGHKVGMFGPGVPALFAAGVKAGISPWTSGRWLNAIAFATIVVLAFLLLRRHVRSSGLALGATAFIAWSTPLLRVVTGIASDPLAIALTLGFLVALEGAVGQPRRRSATIAAAALVWVSFLVRYASGLLLVTGVIAIALVARREGWRVALRRAVTFGALAAVVPVAWYASSAASSGSNALDFRAPSSEGPREIVKLLLQSVRNLTVPFQPPYAAWLLALALASAVVVVLAWPVRRALASWVIDHADQMTPMVVFIVVYVVGVAVSHKTTGSDLNDRILLPAMLPAVVLVAGLLDQVIGVSVERGRRRAAGALVVGLVLVLIGSALWFGRQVSAGDFAGYPTTGARAAHLRRDLAGVGHSALLMSNDPWRIYAATSRQPVELAPITVKPGFSHRPLSIDDVTRALCNDRKVYLAWFRHNPNTTSGPPSAELLGRDRVVIGRATKIQTGNLYRITARETCPSA